MRSVQVETFSMKVLVIKNRSSSFAPYYGVSGVQLYMLFHTSIVFPLSQDLEPVVVSKTAAFPCKCASDVRHSDRAARSAAYQAITVASLAHLHAKTAGITSYDA
jgi:hypothetical protein